MTTSRTPSGRPRPGRGFAALLAACALLAALAPVANAARTNDRPTTGRFTGDHAFNGTITLTFARQDGIGLYLKSYRFKGVQRCDDEQIPLNIVHRTTALTSARVKRDRRFQLNAVPVRIEGRFASSRRVQGAITISTLACRVRGNFSATKRR